LYHNRSAYSSGAPEITPGFQWHSQGRIQDFKLGGVHLKKLRRAEGGANIFGVFQHVDVVIAKMGSLSFTLKL
jgi:hypothetical protein